MSTWFTVNYGLEYRFKHVVPVIPPLDGSTCAFNIQYAADQIRLFLHGSTNSVHFTTFNPFYIRVSVRNECLYVSIYLSLVKTSLLKEHLALSRSIKVKGGLVLQGLGHVNLDPP